MVGILNPAIHTKPMLARAIDEKHLSTTQTNITPPKVLVRHTIILFSASKCLANNTNFRPGWLW